MRSLLTLSIAVILSPSQAGAISYEEDVFPIFKEKCANCHMGGKDKGSVRLDLDRIKGEIGFSVMPDKAVETSPLYDVVSTKERDILMPPPGKGEKLTSRELRAVKDWIEAGAPSGGEVAEGGGGDANPGGLPMRKEEPKPISGQWENNKGKVITATLIRVDGDNAILKIADGREVPYPIANLSEDSQAKVRAFAEGAAE